MVVKYLGDIVIQSGHFVIEGISPVSFEKHLNQYGIFKFDNFEELEEYAYSKWDSPTEKEIELLNNRPNPSDSFLDYLNFYNNIASSEVLRSTILSEKYGAYEKCAETIISVLNKPKKILDIGCNIGYLTTWYARNFTKSVIHGIDNSIKSIQYANKMKNKMNVENVHFNVIDFNFMKFPNHSFDVIIDTQSIYYASNPKKAFSSIKDLITNNGVFITIPGIGDLEGIKQYLNDIQQAGFIISRFDFIECENIGVTEFYPFIIADLNSELIELKVEEKFQEVFSSGRKRLIP